MRVHADLQQVASLVHLLNILVGEDAAGSLQLALALSCSSGDDGLMQTGPGKTNKQKTNKQKKLQ